jgi:hypothetical protein
MIRRGTLVAFNSSTYKADVRLEGSLARKLTDVRVSRAIPSAEMVADRLVAICMFEDRNPRNAVLFAVWTA